MEEYIAAAGSGFAPSHETAGVALRGSFLVDSAGMLRWSVVRGIGQERLIDEHVAALGCLA